MLRKNQIWRDSLSWDKDKFWFILHLKAKGFRASTLKLSLAATIYNNWCEGNLHIFQQKTMDPDSLITKISNAIRDSVTAWRNIKAT